jgi:hypothetical protein
VSEAARKRIERRKAFNAHHHLKLYVEENWWPRRESNCVAPKKLGYVWDASEYIDMRMVSIKCGIELIGFVSISDYL